MKLIHLLPLLILLPGCIAPDRQLAAPLSAGQAGLLARQLASDQAQALYRCHPFDNGPPARLEGGRRLWQDRRGYGQGDLEAKVSFGSNGAGRTVQILLLDSRSEMSR